MLGLLGLMHVLGLLGRCLVWWVGRALRGKLSAVGGGCSNGGSDEKNSVAFCILLLHCRRKLCCRLRYRCCRGAKLSLIPGTLNMHLRRLYFRLPATIQATKPVTTTARRHTVIMPP
jgi:hypothetical protein